MKGKQKGASLRNPRTQPMGKKPSATLAVQREANQEDA